MLEIASGCTVAVLIVCSTLSFYFVNIWWFPKQLKLKAKTAKEMRMAPFLLISKVSSSPQNTSLSLDNENVSSLLFK